MKKLDQSGIAHHLLMVGVVVSVLAVVGFAGYRIYKANTPGAEAYAWSKVLFADKYNIFVCKSDMGDRWLVRAYAKSLTGSSATWRISNATSRSKILGGTTSAYQTTNVHYTIQSKQTLTKIYADVNGGYTAGTTNWDLYKIATC
jgi:hypothetical protein